MKHLRILVFLLATLALTTAALPGSSASAVGGVCFVDVNAGGFNNGSSWTDAFSDLQSALGGSTCSEVWVADGTYKPTTGTDRNVTFQLKDGVAIYGGFAGTESARDERDPATNVAVLSGDLLANDNTNVAWDEPTRADNSIHVVTGANGASLDGFTITGGNATGDSCPGTSCGGGIYNSRVSPTLTNLILRGNSARLGGGMDNDNSANPTLTNITFSGNSANTGGGMANLGAGPAMTNITFSGNAALSGGGMVNIFGNLVGANATLTNVTFSGNSANTGGGINNVVSSPQIRNTIFWGSTGGEIYNNDGSAPVINDGVIAGGCPAGSACTNILTGDPLLGTLGYYGGFTQTIPIPSDSSAFDASSNNCPATDQRGVIRPQGAACDIGAFELVVVVVVDTTPPTLNLPADITTLPSGPAGAVVNYTVTATDAVDPSPDIVCTPPSGSTFPIATTTVNCTATDDAGNVASGSFTVTVGGTQLSATFRSVGAYDGTLRESTEFSGVGNFGDARGYLISVGDDSYKRQYMGMLDFDTSTLPEGAAITEVSLQVKVSYLSANLYTKLGDLMAEVAAPYFGTLPNLQTLDFASAAAANAGNFSRAASGNTWITLNMDPASLFAVDPAGRTQFRLRFPLDDSNDTLKHDIRIFSGNYLNAAYRPLLTITYYVP